MKTIPAEINSLYVKYYMHLPEHRARLMRLPARPMQLQKLIQHLWTIGKDQCLIDCIRAGYSACVAWPEINRIHDWMDADYSEYMGLSNESDHRRDEV